MNLTLISDSDPLLHEPTKAFDIEQLRTSLNGTEEDRLLMYEVDQLATDLTYTMIAHDGLGLAAPQVGVGKSIFVMRVQSGKILTCINPSIISEQPQSDVLAEGCLSYPGQTRRIRRSTRIRVRYWDVNLNLREHWMNRLDARVFAHELDHLSGLTMYDVVEDSDG